MIYGYHKILSKEKKQWLRKLTGIVFVDIDKNGKYDATDKITVVIDFYGEPFKIELEKDGYIIKRKCK